MGTQNGTGWGKHHELLYAVMQFRSNNHVYASLKSTLQQETVDPMLGYYLQAYFSVLTLHIYVLPPAN